VGVNEVPDTIVNCPGCGAAMDVTEHPPFANVICPNCEAESRVKCEFGPYTLVRRHAAGGMSMVFAAHDRTLNREVALKILSEDYSADEMRIEAFEREARITASFSHPNVVRVFTTGRAFGRFYIAMEMVAGGHLENLIRERQKIPELEMLPLAIEVAQGLKAAHSAGLIHRDVKPGNILLDAAGNAKLVDFGLALVTQGGKARATEIWATPYYVPPETVEGHTEDFRSDIYAFGSTLYHSLSGKPPCGEESMATDVLREAKKKVLPLAAVDSSISKATCRIVDRAMAYDPTGRFSSYDELIGGLTRALDDVIAGREDLPEPDGRSHRVWIAAAGVVLISAASVAVWFGNRPATQPVSTTLPRAAQHPMPDGMDHSAEIARCYRAARAAMEAGDFETAEREFGALHDNPQVQEPTRSWAGIEAVLAAFIDARAEDALSRTLKIREHLRTLPSSDPLAGSDWDSLLERLEGLRPLAVSEYPSPTARLAAAMLAGLKNWDQGLIGDAATCFKTVSSVHLPPEDQWAVFYQKMASDFLHDHEILSGPLFSVEPADRTGCEQSIAQLEKTMTALKTRGRARFNVRSWQFDLKRRVILFAASGVKSVSPPEPSKPAGPTPEAVLAKLADFAADRKFAEAALWIKELPDGISGVPKNALLTLAEAASVFLTDIGEDLAREPYAGEIPLRDGARVTQISVGPDGSINAIAASGGTRLCEWKDFTPDALIAMHRVLVTNPASETERLRRHECAIAFDWLAGSREHAVAAATKLSESSPTFKKRWNAISAELSR
jgi:eukaryotic-like serine/threonine-protein kinase